MLMDVDNASDFVKYYSGKYLKGRNGKVWYCGNQRTNEDLDRDQLLLHTEDNTGAWVVKKLVLKNLEDAVYFGIPPLGSLVVNDTELLYVSSAPRREGARGLDIGRLSFNSFNGAELATLGADPFMLDYFGEQTRGRALAKQFLFPTRLPFLEALECIKAEKGIAYCLTDRRFGLYLSSSFHSPILTYMDRKVGYVGTYERPLTQTNTHWLQMMRKEEVPDIEEVVHPLKVVPC